MPLTAKPYWANALQNLQSLIAGQSMSEGVMAQSQKRVLRYREHLEHAAVRSKYRSSSFRGPDHPIRAGLERKPPSYRALLLTVDGRIAGTKHLSGKTDAEASRAAAAIADEHAVDLWDGLRFVEHFEPRRVSMLQRS